MKLINVKVFQVYMLNNFYIFIKILIHEKNCRKHQ